MAFSRSYRNPRYNWLPLQSRWDKCINIRFFDSYYRPNQRNRRSGKRNNQPCQIDNEKDQGITSDNKRCPRYVR